MTQEHSLPSTLPARPLPAIGAQAIEQKRFDDLEDVHLSQLEAERIGRNEARTRFVIRFLTQNGMSSRADELLALKNKCALEERDLGNDFNISQLLWEIRNDANLPSAVNFVTKLYSNINEMLDKEYWGKFLKCWKVWDNIVSIDDHRLLSIVVTTQPTNYFTNSKIYLDSIRDRIIKLMLPYTNWHFWHLDVSLCDINWHPHYHCLFIIPKWFQDTVSEALCAMRREAYWEEGFLINIQYRDTTNYLAGGPLRSLQERQQSWIAALAYVTHVFSERPLPVTGLAPVLSSILDVDNHQDQIERAWGDALGHILKGNDFHKALGARRIALHLRSVTGKKIVSFRQSKVWRVHDRPPNLGQADSTRHFGKHFDPYRTTAREALELARLPLGAVAEPTPTTDAAPEQRPEPAPTKLEQNYFAPLAVPASDHASLSSGLLKKGFKNPVGRPRREIDHQKLMLAIIDGRTSIGAAAILEASTRTVREAMRDAGIDPFPRGRPRALIAAEN